MLANTDMVETKGTMPALARPAAMPKAFCSAIPTLMKRSGKASPKTPILVEWAISAVSATMRGSFLPSSQRTRP